MSSSPVNYTSIVSAMVTAAIDAALASEAELHAKTPRYPRYPSSLPDLPNEIQFKILSYLDRRSMQSAALVNKQWFYDVLDTAPRRESSLLNMLVGGVKNLYSKESFLKASLSQFRKDLKKEDSHKDTTIFQATLKAVDRVVENRRGRILYGLEELIEQNYLTELNLKNLEKLYGDGNQVPPYFFKRLFGWLEIYPEIHRAFQIPDQNTRSDTLCIIAYKLLEQGNIDGALEVAHTIPDVGLQRSAFLCIQDVERALYIPEWERRTYKLI